MKTIQSNFVDLRSDTIYPVEMRFVDGIIISIIPIDEKVDYFILPGFIDAHIHIESSMLTPTQFSKLAVRHGTVATVSDPHEIANVLGVEGVDYMIEDATNTPFNFFFGAPSCVPATSFETAGSTIDVESIEMLMENPTIWYLAEMMNYPGVLQKDPMILAKLAAAKLNGKPIDGHAPGLVGDQAIAYIESGISTDHECFAFDEALHKLNNGMKIIIREGSAAKNFDVLIPLIKLFPEQIMFCSDDKHPDDLLKGHINQLVASAVKLDYNIFDVLRAATINPIKHYGLPIGMMKVGDPADFIVVEDLSDFKVISTYLKGNLVYGDAITKFDTKNSKIVNNFNCAPILESDLAFTTAKHINVIKAIDRSLITTSFQAPFSQVGIPNDILKIVVINRYQPSPVAIAFINGFGIRNGAIASTVAHDSHNIIGVGSDDQSIVNVVNLVIKERGGVAAVCDGDAQILPLPIAGLMSNLPGEEVAAAYESIDEMAKIACGSILTAPFMTLSFMALLVIPSLKLSDKGLFDGNTFQFKSVIVEDT